MFTENQQKIIGLIGLYMTHWSSFELAIDCAAVKVAGISPAQLISLTGGKSLNSKIQFLKANLAKSRHVSEHKATMVVNALKAASIRNSIAHSYHGYGTMDGVTFTHVHGPRNATVLSFTTEAFEGHLREVIDLAASFSKEFAETPEESAAIVEAAQALSRVAA